MKHLYLSKYFEVDYKYPSCRHKNLDLENYFIELEVRLNIFESKYCKLVLFGGPFIASKGRSHFHKPTYEWAEYISKENILVFYSHKEAEDAGTNHARHVRLKKNDYFG